MQIWVAACTDLCTLFLISLFSLPLRRKKTLGPGYDLCGFIKWFETNDENVKKPYILNKSRNFIWYFFHNKDVTMQGGQSIDARCIALAATWSYRTKISIVNRIKWPFNRQNRAGSSADFVYNDCIRNCACRGRQKLHNATFVVPDVFSLSLLLLLLLLLSSCFIRRSVAHVPCFVLIFTCPAGMSTDRGQEHVKIKTK